MPSRCPAAAHLVTAFLRLAILDGDSDRAVSEAKALLSQGVDASVIVVQGIEPAMLDLDGKCTAEDFDLLEIMLAGRAVTEVMKLLYPEGVSRAAAKGAVVIATPQGDVHDLGKNIFRMILIGNGYRVFDCGRDCPLDRLVEAVESEAPLAIGVSGLISTVIPMVRKLRGLLQAKGLADVKLLAGGAALKQCSPQMLDVDFVADTAFDGIHYLNDLMGTSALAGNLQ